MDDKITLQILAAKLAVASGLKKKTCEDFIRELFTQVTTELENGESIKVKGLGTFKLTTVEARKSVNVSTGREIEIPAHHKVSFTPTKDLAALVNGNLGHLEPVELSDNLSQKDIDFISSADDNEIENAEKIAPTDESGETEQTRGINQQQLATEKDSIPEYEDTPEVTPTIYDIEEDAQIENQSPQSASSVNKETETTLTDSEIIESDSETGNPETSQEDKSSNEITLQNNDTKPATDEVEITEEQQETVQEDIEQNYIKMRRVRNSSFVGGFLTGLLMTGAIILCFSYFNNITYSPKVKTTTTKSDTEQTPTRQQIATVAANDSATSQNQAKIAVEKPAGVAATDNNPVPTQPSDSKIYDTITTTRYLTTMARDHYGSYHLWPYIYEENKAFLGHPDRIRPGTKVVIPNLKKYNVDPKNPSDIAKAKKLGAAIYARYQ